MSARKRFGHSSRKIAALNNPVARALERRDSTRWEHETAAYLDALKPGAECRKGLEHILSFICPAMKAIEGWDDPDDVGDVLVAAVEAVCDMLNDGDKWRPEHGALIKDAINYAKQIITRMPVENVAAAKAFTDALLIRAKEVA